MHNAPARLLAVCLAAVAALSGQQEPPVFRAGARLVEVTVTVLDKKEAAVTGLAASDFTVLDGGKPRPIAFFRFEGVTEVPAQGPPPVQGLFTNRVEASGGPPRNITALVLDTLNTRPKDSTASRAQMMRYLKALTPETRVAIFHMGDKLTTLYDFTDDVAGLRKRIEKVVLGAPVNALPDVENTIIEAEQFVDMFAGDPDTQELAIRMKGAEIQHDMDVSASARRVRMESSLDAMESLGRHLAGIPGRKNLVWIGGGFSMMSMGSTDPTTNPRLENFEKMVQETSQRLAQEGISLYIVDARGLEASSNTSAAHSDAPMPLRGRGRFEPQLDAERASSDPRSAMHMMASITGGRYMFDSNDLAQGFRKTVADLRGAYTIGFYAPEAPDNRWHKLKVNVTRPGVSVRHREGYLATAAAAESLQWTDEMWRTVISNPLGSSVIPLTAHCETTPGGEIDLALVIDVKNLDFHADGGNLRADLQVAIVERTADGQTRPRFSPVTASVPAADLEALRARGISLRRQWKPGPDAATVRVVVRDTRTGQYGSVDVPLRGLPSAAGL
jgi:VWFA-related protein